MKDNRSAEGTSKKGSVHAAESETEEYETEEHNDKRKIEKVTRKKKKMKIDRHIEIKIENDGTILVIDNALDIIFERYCERNPGAKPAIYGNEVNEEFDRQQILQLKRKAARKRHWHDEAKKRRLVSNTPDLFANSELVDLPNGLKIYINRSKKRAANNDVSLVTDKVPLNSEPVQSSDGSPMDQDENESTANEIEARGDDHSESEATGDDVMESSDIDGNDVNELSEMDAAAHASDSSEISEEITNYENKSMEITENNIPEELQLSSNSSDNLDDEGLDKIVEHSEKSTSLIDNVDKELEHSINVKKHVEENIDNTLRSFKEGNCRIENVDDEMVDYIGDVDDSSHDSHDNDSVEGELDISVELVDKNDLGTEPVIAENIVKDVEDSIHMNKSAEKEYEITVQSSNSAGENKELGMEVELPTTHVDNVIKDHIDKYGEVPIHNDEITEREVEKDTERNDSLYENEELDIEHEDPTENVDDTIENSIDEGVETTVEGSENLDGNEEPGMEVKVHTDCTDNTNKDHIDDDDYEKSKHNDEYVEKEVETTVSEELDEELDNSKETIDGDHSSHDIICSEVEGTKFERKSNSKLNEFQKDSVRNDNLDENEELDTEDEDPTESVDDAVEDSIDKGDKTTVEGSENLDGNEEPGMEIKVHTDCVDNTNKDHIEYVEKHYKKSKHNDEYVEKEVEAAVSEDLDEDEELDNSKEQIDADHSSHDIICSEVEETKINKKSDRELLFSSKLNEFQKTHNVPQGIIDYLRNEIFLPSEKNMDGLNQIVDEEIEEEGENENIENEEVAAEDDNEKEAEKVDERNDVEGETESEDVEEEEDEKTLTLENNEEMEIEDNSENSYQLHHEKHRDHRSDLRSPLLSVQNQNQPTSANIGERKIFLAPIGIPRDQATSRRIVWIPTIHIVRAYFAKFGMVNASLTQDVSRSPSINDLITNRALSS